MSARPPRPRCHRRRPSSPSCRFFTMISDTYGARAQSHAALVAAQQIALTAPSFDSHRSSTSLNCRTRTLQLACTSNGSPQRADPAHDART